MKLFKLYFEETEIESLEALIANPDPERVKMYGGTGYVDMLKKKLERAKKAQAIQSHLKQSPLGKGIEDNEESVKIAKMFDEYMRKGEAKKAKEIMFSIYDHDPDAYQHLYKIYRTQYPTDPFEDAEDDVNDDLYDQYSQEGYKIGLEKFKSPKKAEQYAKEYAQEMMERPGPHG